MCGNESTIRVERVGNGFTIDAYTPGEKDKPGTHKRSVATSAAHVVQAVGAHLKVKGKGGGIRLAGGDSVNGPSSLKKTGKKKRTAYKR